MSEGPLVVLAELLAQPGQHEKLAALATAFAAQCLALEPGCRQFQVTSIGETPPALLFFEVYDNPEAFELHGRSLHLAAFRQARSALLAGERPLRRGRLIEARP